MQKLIWVAVIILALVGGLVLYQTNLAKSTSKTTTNKQKQVKVQVSITPDGFSPEEITIKKGNTVAWINEDKDYRWPASDLHPTHEIYPEFDPKEPIETGEKWIFTFEKVGNWKYHDHLKPNKKGLVVVQE